MRVTLLSFVILVSAMTVVMADHDEGKGNGHGKDTVVVGPPGQDGAPGKDGVGIPGTNGTDGINGTDGSAGSAANVETDLHHLTETKYTLQGAVRLFDSRKWQFNTFGKFDVRHTRGYAIGVEAVYKLGKSYEEKMIIELKRLIAELKAIAHQPAVHQVLYFQEERKD